MNICVVGLGRIGLPTAIMLSKSGYTVFGVDIDKKRLDAIRSGSKEAVEGDLLSDLRVVLEERKLIPSDKPTAADVYIFCVPTLLRQGSCDLSALLSAIDTFAPLLTPGKLVIVESTVPPHTLDKVIVGGLRKHGVDLDRLFLASAPERIMPGQTKKEIVENDRIIGGINKESAERAARIYRSFVKGRIQKCDSTTAEMVKLMENTYRDVNIALANQFALNCEEQGIDVWRAIELANTNPRVNIHQPGPGVGGHCVPITPLFLAEKVSRKELILTARSINDSMLHLLADSIKRRINGQELPRASVLGLSYRGNVNDRSNSPGIALAKELGQHFDIVVHDPYGPPDDSTLHGVSIDEALRSDAVVVMVDDDYYVSMVPPIAPSKGAWVLDTRNCLRHRDWEEKGWEVQVLGVAGRPN